MVWVDLGGPTTEPEDVVGALGPLHVQNVEFLVLDWILLPSPVPSRDEVLQLLLEPMCQGCRRAPIDLGTFRTVSPCAGFHIPGPSERLLQTAS